MLAECPLSRVVEPEVFQTLDHFLEFGMFAYVLWSMLGVKPKFKPLFVL